MLREPSVAGRSGAEATPPVGETYDAVLIAAQAGAVWAWTLLYRSVGASLLALLRAGGDSDPEETAGDIFAEVGRGIHSFGGDEHAFRLWVMSVAYRRLLHVRPQRMRSAVAPRSSDALAPWAADLLDSLSVDERDVVLLRCIACLGWPGIATVTATSVPAVQGIYRDALLSIRLAASRRRLPATGPWRLGDTGGCSPAPNPAEVDEGEAILTALAQVPAVSDELEHAHVAVAVRSSLKGSATAPVALPRRAHRAHSPLSLAGIAAVLAAVSAKTIAATAIVLAATGGVLLTQPPPEPPPAASPGLERAAGNAGFALPAADQHRKADAPAFSAGENRAERAYQAHSDASAAKAAGQAKAAEARLAGQAHRADGQARAAAARKNRPAQPPVVEQGPPRDTTRRDDDQKVQPTARRRAGLLPKLSVPRTVTPMRTSPPAGRRVIEKGRLLP